MKSTLPVLFLLLCLRSFSQTDSRGIVINRINEERFIKINGIEQWITIKGDSTRPVILFLHGGPGNAMSPFSEGMYGEWEKHFTLVQWDQRGTGRTYGRNAPEELTPAYIQSNPLHVDQVTSDGIGVARYLVQRLKKEKLILCATSWGTVPGIKMALKEPELFYAYFGHSQVVDPAWSLGYAYQQVYLLAKDAKDQSTLDILASIGQPPYPDAKNLGQLLRLVRKAEQQHIQPPSPSMFQLSPAYDNEEDLQHRNDGEDYSFINFTGDKKLGVVPLISSINFLNDELNFTIPVYLLQGKEDIQTPEILTRKFFNQIKAPKKEFISLSRCGHGFNQLVIEAQLKMLTQSILPLINGQ